MKEQVTMNKDNNPGIPAPKEYNHFFEGYINSVGSENPLILLKSDFKKQLDLLDSSPGLELDYAYEHDKWNLRQLIVHMIDAERIMSFRLLAAMRMDNNDYSGYDYIHYASKSHSDKREWAKLRREWKIVRKSFLSLARQIEGEQWKNSCVVDGETISARALVFIVAGHARVHFKTIQSKYLP